MGFYLNLLVVHRQTQYKNTEHTIWGIEGILSLGRVTGVEKVVLPDFQHLTWSGKQRAAVCITDEIYNRLSLNTRTPDKDDYAPLFITEKFDVMEGPPGKVFKQRYPRAREWVLPVQKDSFEKRLKTLPKEKILSKHNKAITLNQKAFARHIKGPYDIIEDTPLAWEPCENVARWLREMQAMDGVVWQALAKDPTALSYATAWRTYLGEMGKVGARVIFLFDQLEIPSFM